MLGVLGLPAHATQFSSDRAQETGASVTVRAVDALFGFPLGGTVVVTSPDEVEHRYHLENGSARITADPSDRRYQAAFDGPGISRPLMFSAVSGGRTTLRVVTYLDIAALILLNVVVAGAYLVARRVGPRGIRARLSERVSWPGLARRMSRAPAPQARSLVRVRLTSGRVVEGWVDPPQSGQEEEVLILRPISAIDATGRSDTPTPLDSFIPMARVVVIETLDESLASTATNPAVDRHQRIVDLRESKQAESK
ncbi:hypothetical protein BH20ACT23_BH20ACT23_02610 [soil metagenome]